MPHIVFIQPDGDTVEVRAKAGESVMFAASRAGVDGIEAECGGSGMCGTCHCYVDERVDVLPDPTPEEANILQWVVDPQENSRLTCQLVVSDAIDGAVFRVPATQF